MEGDHVFQKTRHVLKDLFKPWLVRVLSDRRSFPSFAFQIWPHIVVIGSCQCHRQKKNSSLFPPHLPVSRKIYIIINIIIIIILIIIIIIIPIIIVIIIITFPCIVIATRFGGRESAPGKICLLFADMQKGRWGGGGSQDEVKIYWNAKLDSGSCCLPSASKLIGWLLPMYSKQRQKHLGCILYIYDNVGVALTQEK